MCTTFVTNFSMQRNIHRGAILNVDKMYTLTYFELLDLFPENLLRSNQPYAAYPGKMKGDKVYNCVNQKLPLEICVLF